MSSPQTFASSSDNIIKNESKISVDENERVMHILSQLEDFKEPNNSIKYIHPLKNNNFLFAINFMNASHPKYKYEKKSNESSIAKLIKKLTYCFELFTHIQLSNQENLNLFDILNEQEDQKPHRFKKKFVTFQYFDEIEYDPQTGSNKNSMDKNNNVLVSFHALLEYFIDNVQQSHLFNFFPQLCSAALDANINLYLYNEGKIVKKEFKNTVNNISGFFEPNTLKQYDLLVNLEKGMSISGLKVRQTYNIAIFCDGNHKVLKYFAIFPAGFLYKSSYTKSILDDLTNEWTIHYNMTSVHRFNIFFPYFLKFEDLTLHKMFKSLNNDLFDGQHTLFTRYAISKNIF